VSGVHLASQKQIFEPHSLYFGFKPHCVASFKPSQSSWSELIEQTVSLQDILESANQIMEELFVAQSFSKRVQAIHTFTLEHMADSDYIPDLAEFVELRLCASHGTVNIETIGEYTCYSTRHCRERFKKACGISQKSYANIMRFQNTIRMLTHSASKQTCDFADIIAENGYFDQSHLNREFRRFSDSTPSRFLQELKNN
jgi:AraC-like DNA-binding protein